MTTVSTAADGVNLFRGLELKNLGLRAGSLEFGSELQFRLAGVAQARDTFAVVV